MAQAIRDLEELQRFACSLQRFIDSPDDAVGNLNGAFASLGDSWQDEKRARFEEDYNVPVQQSVGNDLFSYFELRVAYCMNEDDAGSHVSCGIGKFKGIEKPNRAVFVNKMMNDIAWFRPYVQEGAR